MLLYTIGFTKKSAQEFFETLKLNRIRQVIDVRLNNSSQLAGFTKGNDLKYFLKQLIDVDYTHRPDLAPSKSILDGYKNKVISWEDYENLFEELMLERGSIESIISDLKNNFDSICFLCSEPDADNCHRRLVAEAISSRCQEVTIVHL